MLVKPGLTPGVSSTRESRLYQVSLCEFGFEQVTWPGKPLPGHALLDFFSAAQGGRRYPAQPLCGSTMLRCGARREGFLWRDRLNFSVRRSLNSFSVQVPNNWALQLCLAVELDLAPVRNVNQCPQQNWTPTPDLPANAQGPARGYPTSSMWISNSGSTDGRPVRI